MSRRAGLDTPMVVAAAVELVDVQGYDELTLAALAEKLRIRIPSLYNHIAGLDGLRRALAHQGIDMLTSVLTSAVLGKAGDEALLAIGHAYRAFAKEHPGLYTAVTHAPSIADEALEQVMQAPVAVVMSVLVAYDLHADDALHAVRGLRSIAHGFVSLEISGGFGLPLDLDESYRRLLHTFINGLHTPQTT